MAPGIAPKNWLLVSSKSRNSSPGFSLAYEPGALRPGHHMELLFDGDQIFPAMLDAIAAATSSIWLETYIFESDKIGLQFVEALAKRAREGLEVLLLVDAFGGLELSASDEDFMRNAGVELVYFGRFNHLQFRRWLKRDHRKLLLVDQEIAFVGGINISEHYASTAQGGKGWHDLHLRIRGPVCSSLADSFLRVWLRASDIKRSKPPHTQASTAKPVDEGEWAMALCSTHSGVRTQIRRHLLHALKNAQKEVFLASAYFVPDRGLMRALIDTASRGVEVRLLLPGESDVVSVQRAGEHSYERLLNAGVKIHTYLGTHMHSKAAVVDRRWCTFGSYNLDFASLLYNLELVVEVVGDTSPPQLAAHLQSDFAKSPEVELARWKTRPMMDRAISSLAYQFRRIL